MIYFLHFSSFCKGIFWFVFNHLLLGKGICFLDKISGHLFKVAQILAWRTHDFMFIYSIKGNRVNLWCEWIISRPFMTKEQQQNWQLLCHTLQIDFKVHEHSGHFFFNSLSPKCLQHFEIFVYGKYFLIFVYDKYLLNQYGLVRGFKLTLINISFCFNHIWWIG